jgi:hypothetical protein
MFVCCFISSLQQEQCLERKYTNHSLVSNLHYLFSHGVPALKNWEWYSVTKIVLTYCEKKMF